jgi:hypothetical protein
MKSGWTITPRHFELAQTTQQKILPLIALLLSEFLGQRLNLAHGR